LARQNLREFWERTKAMMALKFLVMIAGLGFLGTVAALVAYDIFLSAELRRLLQRDRAVARLS
jgi:hypothetical protein